MRWDRSELSAICQSCTDSRDQAAIAHLSAHDACLVGVVQGAIFAARNTASPPELLAQPGHQAGELSVLTLVQLSPPRLCDLILPAKVSHGPPVMPESRQTLAALTPAYALLRVCLASAPLGRHSRAHTGMV